MPSSQRLGEFVELRASVVHIKLPLDLIAAPLQDAPQGIPVGRPASVPGMQRPRRVGAHEFQIHPMTFPENQAAIIPLLRHDLLQHSVPPRVGEMEIHEPRPSHLHPAHMQGQTPRQRLADLPSQIPRRLPSRPSQSQSRIRRPIPMLPASRLLQRNLANLQPQPGKSPPQGIAQNISNIGHGARNCLARDG